MTGFASRSGIEGEDSWRWDARSLNSRNLEIRCFLPEDMVSLETTVRKRVKQRFARGNLSIRLRVEHDDSNIIVREPTLKMARRTVRHLMRVEGIDFAAAVQLLSLPGVMVADKGKPEAFHAGLVKPILDDLDAVLDDLEEQRRQEGLQLAEVMVHFVHAIEECTVRAIFLAEVQPQRIHQTLQSRIAAFCADQPAIDNARIEQEIVMLAVKADVREELNRINVHVEAVRHALQEESSGKRLEFLCQELAREANTLCAKSGDPDLVEQGLEMKVQIDRLREQVLNIA